MAAGAALTCALSAGGGLACWGGNGQGEATVPVSFSASGVALPCRPAGLVVASVTSSVTSTSSVTPSVTATRSLAPTATATRTPSHTATPYCAASDFRPLPRTDLVGSLVGAALSPARPVLVPSEPACRQACCLAPTCDGYSFEASALSFHTESNCFLYVNVTQLAPNSGYASGLRESVLL